MKEQLISFETAKLAKEKGFDLECNLSDYAFGTFDGVYKRKTLACRHAMIFSRWINDREKISAPTQSLLQKWLREVHGIHILMSLAVPTLQHRSVIYQVKEGKVITVMDFTATDNENYEEVLEVGLQEALKLIQ